MIVYELATGNRPFSVDDSSQTLCVMIMKIIMGDRPTVPTDLPPECQSYLGQCWDSSPSLRPAFKVLLQNILVQIKRAQQEIDDESSEQDHSSSICSKLN